MGLRLGVLLDPTLDALGNDRRLRSFSGFADRRLVHALLKALLLRRSIRFGGPDRLLRRATGDREPKGGETPRAGSNRTVRNRVVSGHGMGFSPLNWMMCDQNATVLISSIDEKRPPLHHNAQATYGRTPPPLGIPIKAATKIATFEVFVPRSTPGRVREVSVVLKDGCLSTLKTCRAPEPDRAEKNC